jgi:ethanolamine utilization cobalamin adenosyltransferase
MPQKEKGLLLLEKMRGTIAAHLLNKLRKLNRDTTATACKGIHLTGYQLLHPL